MAYIGSTPTSQNFISGTDYFNGTGSQTAFTLTRSVNSVNDVEVVVNNVIQQPNSYTVSGTTLTLSAAPSSGTSNVYVRYLATNQQSFTVGNNTVSYNQLTADMQSKFAMKNRIINGAMVIDQRNGGASVTISTDPQYTLDRWRCAKNGSINNFTCQRSSTAPSYFANSMLFTAGTGVTPVTTDYAALTQAIEGYNIADLGWGTASAQTVTVSFWVRSSLTGSFGGSIRSGGGTTRSYVFSYTINSANTWEYKTVTIPGDTSGTYPTDNTAGLTLNFDLGVGPSYSSTASGSWVTGNLFGLTGGVKLVATTGATFYITGVQLEVGSSATGFEYRQYGQELALCQRYYFRYTNNTGAATQIANLQAYSTSGAFGKIMDLPVSMRTNPTTYNNSGSLTPNNAGGGVTTAFTGGTLDKSSSQFLGTGGFTGSSGLVAGNSSVISLANNGYLEASAEL